MSSDASASAPSSEERAAWLRLALTPGIGPAFAARLVEALGSPSAALLAPPSRWQRLLGADRGRALYRAARAVRPERVLRAAADTGQRVLTPADPDWPTGAAAALPDPPLVLFLEGDLPEAGGLPPVAVVGTREAGHYGLDVARRIARDLARHGLWIVSGLALGIDGAAHHGALATPEGRTLAVLGCGIDVDHPVDHADLKRRIPARGGILSEHPPGTSPRPGHFPRRNRLVAALAEAVVVVEAPARSGALITAQLAADMGRTVLAVPGTAGSLAFRGSHRLLRDGALLCEGARDVLHALEIGARVPDAPAARVVPPPSGPPLAVWSVLTEQETCGIDTICRRTGLGPTEVAVALARLELDGYVARTPGAGVRRLDG